MLTATFTWDTHTHTHAFNGLVSRTTWVSWHQKGKPFWILLKQEMMGGSGISWPYASHLHHTQTDNHASTGRMLFLMPNQQCQSTEGNSTWVSCGILIFQPWYYCNWHWSLDHSQCQLELQCIDLLLILTSASVVVFNYDDGDFQYDIIT